MFEQVVFAGGGNRCWWQAGFWDVAAPQIGLRPRLIAGVSAGAATACMLYANSSAAVLAYYAEHLRDVRRNAEWRNLLRPGERVFPHARIYRRALKDVLGGPYFQRLIDTAPEIRVQFSRLPRHLGPRLATGVGLVAYNIDKYWRKSLHPVLGRRLGFTPEIARVTDCTSDDDLVSLLTASSCTPPFTPIEYRGGRPTLDGGMVDNVPVDAVERNVSTLVLVTRRYPGRANLFVHQGRLYVQPSAPVAASSWDYTNYASLQATYEQGRRDARSFIADWARHPVWLTAPRTSDSADHLEGPGA